MSHEDDATLRELSDTSPTVALPEREIRGRTVKDTDGKAIGTVDTLLFDDRNRRVRFIRVDVASSLELGNTRVLIPMDVIVQITDDTVYINRSGEHVAGAPRIDAALAATQSYYNELSRYYGCPVV